MGRTIILKVPGRQYGKCLPSQFLNLQFFGTARFKYTAQRTLRRNSTQVSSRMDVAHWSSKRRRKYVRKGFLRVNYFVPYLFCVHFI